MKGKVDPIDAIRQTLPRVYASSEAHPVPLEELLARVEQHLLWTTWQRLEEVVARAAKSFSTGDRSVDASIARTVKPILGCVRRHQR